MTEENFNPNGTPQPPAGQFPPPPETPLPPVEPAAPPPPPGGMPPPPPSSPPPSTAPTGAVGSLDNPTKDERNWAMFAHLSALVAGLLSTIIHVPVLAFLGPLVIYLVKKDDSPFVADQAKEALNFFISVSIVMAILFVLTFTVILAIITIPLMILIALAALVLCIMAAIKASNGELYRYPLTLRLIN